MSELPPINAKVAPKTYWMTCVFAVPILALAIFLYPKPGQQTYALIFAGVAVFCFANVATIRLKFDGRRISYSSLMTRTIIQMDEVTGAKIGYSEARGGQAFFFLSAQKRGDLMLNLPLFSRKDGQEFCHRLMEFGIYPEVANGMRARLIANALYPNGWQPGEESDE